MSLEEITSEMIIKNGPISFCDFMEMALYFPGLGYYSSPAEKFGRNGDYYTSPYVTPVFGELIAKQIEEMWLKIGGNEFVIIEFGGGNGLLCYDILQHLKKNSRLYDNLRYCIIEKTNLTGTTSKIFLNEKVYKFDSIEDIGSITGCILSNEVVDNFAVHQVVMKDELMEVFVGYSKSGFTEIYIPASQEIKDYLGALDIHLPKGFRTEINLQAVNWIKEISEVLQKGYMLTIDYGYTQSQLYNSSRSAGSLLCYTKHTINADPYKNMGGQDITAHVNFSALAHWGSLYGLEFCGFTNQAQFLLSLGLTNHLKKMEDENNYNSNDKSLMTSFLLDMGSKFKILIQCKGNVQKTLTGLQFCQRLF